MGYIHQPSSTDLRDIDRPQTNATRDVLTGIIGGVLWVLWQAVRWPTLALLIVLEPLVRVILCGLALLGVLTAFFWQFVVHPPGFPVFTTLGLSLACVPLLALYYAVLRFLSGR